MEPAFINLFTQRFRLKSFVKLRQLRYPNGHFLTCPFFAPIKFFQTAHGTIKFTVLYDRLFLKSYYLPRRHYDATIKNLDLTAARLAASSSPRPAACLRTKDSIFSFSLSWSSCNCSDLSDS